MKKKKIIIGSLLVVLLLLLLPSVSATQFNTTKETKKLSYPIEKTNIPPYIWFAIFILILSIANRLQHPETSGIV